MVSPSEHFANDCGEFVPEFVLGSVEAFEVDGWIRQILEPFGQLDEQLGVDGDSCGVLALVPLQNGVNYIHA